MQKLVEVKIKIKTIDVLWLSAWSLKEVTMALLYFGHLSIHSDQNPA